MTMSFALDHDYCSVVPSDDDSKTEIATNEDASTKPRAERKQAICPRVDPDMETSPINETSYFEARSSSSSPAHSMDSGVDPGMEDFLADFPSSWADADFGLNDEDIKDLEDLLNLNEQTNELSSAKAGAETRPVRKVLGQFGKRQQMPEEDEQAVIEKNKKNAIAARENRQKKKKYVEGLENDVAQLKEENKTLKARNESFTSVMRKLTDEVKYLRNVLANESTISLLLKSVAATPGISLSSSLVQSSSNEEPEKESDRKEEERQYATRSRKRRSAEGAEAAPSKRSRSTASGGVCLHVSGGKVSLELCEKCERKAKQSGVL